MTKIKTKFMVILLTIITMTTLCSTFSFATQEENSQITNPEDNASAETTQPPTDSGNGSSETTEGIEQNTGEQSTANIHQGDLYVFENDITMDKLVNGNVYLFGNNIKVTGQVAGNLYAFGNTITFEQSYIQSSVYVAGNQIAFKGVANDLYAVCDTLEIPTDCGVYRDLRVSANTLNMSGIIGRDAFVDASNITLTKDNTQVSIYGNFNYNSKSQVEIPEGAVEGEVKFNQIQGHEKTTSDKVLSYVMKALSVMILAIVVLFACKWLAPRASEKFETALSKKWLISLGIGVLALVLVPIASVILMITSVAFLVGIILLGLYFIMIALSTSTLSIAISKLLTKKFNLSKTYMEFIMVAVVALVLWALTLIPYVGFLVAIVKTALGLGILSTTIGFKKLLEDKSEK